MKIPQVANLLSFHKFWSQSIQSFDQAVQLHEADSCLDCHGNTNIESHWKHVGNTGKPPLGINVGCKSSRWHGEGALPVIREEDLIILDPFHYFHFPSESCNYLKYHSTRVLPFCVRFYRPKLSSLSKSSKEVFVLNSSSPSRCESKETQDSWVQEGEGWQRLKA